MKIDDIIAPFPEGERMRQGRVVGGGPTTHSFIRNTSRPLSNMLPNAASTYEPIFFYDLWEGLLPFQGKHLGSIRVSGARPWFGRFKAPALISRP